MSGSSNVDPAARALTVIATDEGERRFITEEYGVSAPYLLTEAAAAELNHVRLAYVAHVADVGEIGRHLAPGSTLALDISDADIDRVMLATVGILFASAPDGSEIVAQARAAELLTFGPRIVVVTRGAGGALALEQGKPPIAYPAATGEIVDTLGAGDALAAGFLSAWLSGASLHDALGRGIEAAAIACSHFGALPG